MAEQILAALFVLGLLFAMVWVLRRKGLVKSGRLWKDAVSSKQIELLERVALTPQHSIHLVRVGDEFLLVGVSPSTCSTLTALKTTVTAVDARRVS
jgi:flagellar biosynthetic protein FliO